MDLEEESVGDLSIALLPLFHTMTSGSHPKLVPESHLVECQSPHHMFERHEWNPTSPGLWSLNAIVSEVGALPALLVGTNPLCHLKVPLVFAHSHPG